MHFSVEQVAVFYVVYMIASALVQALPAPNGNPWYNTLYKFLSILISDFKSYAASISQPVPVITVSAGKITTTEVPVQK